ncbi:MAG: HD domain-containing protein [Planctomycetes bacterium]|nr:HD domain-containing protein [Planctomycetota bacterium]
MNARIYDKYRTLLEAVSFAGRAHQGQLRKDKETPYACHPFRVCFIVRHVFGFDDPRMLSAALLHDTIEDTTTDFDDLEERFGAEIAGWVACLTKDKSLPEKEREQAYIAKLLEAPWQVQACKLADMFDNLMDLPALPPERRQHSLRRAEQYLAALKTRAAPQLQAPLKLVDELLKGCSC